MTFTIITHVPHGKALDTFYAYSPYIREMNVWIKNADEIRIVAPLTLKSKTAIETEYIHGNIKLIPIPAMNMLSFLSIIKLIWQVPLASFQIVKEMSRGDHIHVRCPGNIGLLGCIFQVFFPRKQKTAKYAGNWDNKANEPLSYRMQRWLLNNTKLSKNMTVLVYGRWQGSSQNIKPFFTASYRESEKFDVAPRALNHKIKLLFVATLSRGKRPLYAIRLAELLRTMGHNVTLDMYGEGASRPILEQYISDNQLVEFVTLHGNREASEIKEAFSRSHFIILPSKSEGWPKVLAEAMFWGCVPASTSVSCVPFMLDYGYRGVFLNLEMDDDAKTLIRLFEDQEAYNTMSIEGVRWSRQYTLDVFESEIKKLIR